MNKPFIKLFRSPNDFYFYEVGRDEILRVDAALYDYLNSVLSDESASIDEEVAARVEALREYGYLSDKKPETIRHPSTDSLPLLLERKMSAITLQLTQDCNFRCAYCIYSEEKNKKQRSHSRKHMSWETAKKAIDFFLEHSIDSERRNVGFYGGEPLLRFELLQQIVEYAEMRLIGRPLTFSLTTNGSLLTEEIAAYLYAHNVNTLISLDGPKEINDKNRVFKSGEGTFDTVMCRVSMLKEKQPDFFNKLSVNMVLDPSNDIDCVNSITMELSDMDIANITARTMDSTDGIIKYPSDFISKFQYLQFLAYLSHTKRFPSESLPLVGHGYGQEITRLATFLNAGNGMSNTTAPGGPCVPGKNRLLVNVDEQLFPCERVNENDAMCIGTLDKGLDLNRVEIILNVATLTADKCKNCWAQRHCTLCAKMADEGNQLSAKERESYCSSSISAAENKLQAIILLQEVEKYYNQPLIVL
jgi:uncharacterized protein